MLKGIDVSNHKSDLRLANVAADFVIAKATGGDGYVDPFCDMFVQAAIVQGKKWGVYHYYADGYDGTDPVKEADFFVDNCQGYVGRGLLILDWEKGGNAYWQDTRKAKAWLDRVYARTGVKPLIYMSFSLTQELDWGEVIQAGYGLWVADYVDDTVPIANYGMDAARDPNPAWDGTVGDVMWQFTSAGKLDGYNGPLDCNFFYGDTKTWDAYAALHVASTPEPTTTTTTTVAPAPEPETTTTTTTAPAPVTTTTTTVEQPDDKPAAPLQVGGFSLLTISKSLAGFAAGIIITWAAKHNLVISDNLPDVIEQLLAGAIAALVVYFAPKNKQ